MKWTNFGRSRALWLSLFFCFCLSLTSFGQSLSAPLLLSEVESGYGRVADSVWRNLAIQWEQKLSEDPNGIWLMSVRDLALWATDSALSAHLIGIYETRLEDYETRLETARDLTETLSKDLESQSDQIARLQNELKEPQALVDQAREQVATLQNNNQILAIALSFALIGVVGGILLW